MNDCPTKLENHRPGKHEKNHACIWLFFLETGKRIAGWEHTILGFAVDNCKPAGDSLVLILSFVKEELNRMKNNNNNLQKLERLLGEAEYKLRYERGNFQSGFCILEAKKVVVLNKFLDMEGRMNTLTDLIPQLKINIDNLTQESQKLYEELIAAEDSLPLK